MKRFILFFAFLCLAKVSIAQASNQYENIVLKKPDDYRAVDTMVLRLSKNLLNTPIDAAKEERFLTEKFIFRWMDGTADYTFVIDDKTQTLGENKDLMGLYFAAMIKFEMENPELKKDPLKVNLGTWKILLAYCENPGNHVKQTKKLKKVIEANKSGDLESIFNPDIKKS